MTKDKTLLVIDDSKVSRMMICAIVNNKQPDISIHEASNGDEALSLCKDTVIDFFSIDYNMPGDDGLELIRKLKTQFPDSKYILLTANIQDSIHKKAEELGAACINKPINEESIDEMLEFFYAE